MPVVDEVAADYQDTVAFLAVAGRSSPEASEARVGDWFSAERIRWGYSDEIWAQYGVRGQPVTFLISGDDRVVAAWFGVRTAEEIRAELDRLVALGV